MLDIRKRWQSIDIKLPLLASGLVVLTVVVLGWPTYALLERALFDAAGQRLHATATAAAQLAGRPNPRIGDSSSPSADATLKAYLRGAASRRAALAELAHVATAADTIRHYAALLDATGNTLLWFGDSTTRPPRWPAAAIARGEILGDTTSYGPFEAGNDIPTLSLVRPLRDGRSPSAPVLGYVVESRGLASARGARLYRNLLGPNVHVLIGQPDAGVWTDFERIAAAPPVRPIADSIVFFDHGVGAAARVPGTNRLVWLSLPKAAVVAPAQRLLFSMIPIGLAIALVGAAVMWMVTRRITHPIVQLTDAAENVARDNGASGLQPTVHMAPGADEVTRLRYAFERMAHRVSERQTLELQLRHAQKMEAVGRLAGGVAHDFNNLLTAIRSYADLMLDDMPEWDPKRGDALEIRTAAQRAAALTAQLLAFSRKQMLQPRVLNTAAVLTEVKGMLARLLIEDIHLEVNVPAGLWQVKADRGQLEQVIVNLAVNSRDAMPHGGLLHISAVNDVVLDPIATRDGDIPPGEYVAIRVTDSGIGMDLSTLARAFEPFFTTKPTGQGTGLGLSTVHGIIHQSGGYVTIESFPQHGTTIAVYLPRVHEAPDTDTKGVILAQKGNHETILLVEDELAVRSLARRVLEKAGYRVLESASPSDALRLAQTHQSVISLVLSDVVMPEMSGPTLVTKVMGICPQARVLFISGYTDDEVIGRGLANPGMMLLQKPFSAQELVERVRVALDQRPQTTGV